MKTLDLPSAFGKIEELAQKPLLIFLDYDGTVTPIIPQPEKAFLSSSMKETIQKLAAKFPVVLVSGRELAVLQEFVAIEGIYYAGSHGIEISGPNGLNRVKEEAKKSLFLLKELENQLSEFLKRFQGALLERKRFSIAVHYRNVEEPLQLSLKQQVEELVGHPKGLKWRYGKKVLELQPDIDWDKGKAVLWLLEHLQISPHFPLYIGDDLTDEDAFKVLNDKGMTIVICDEDRETAAQYGLRDTQEVQLFLQRLIEHESTE